MKRTTFAVVCGLFLASFVTSGPVFGTEREDAPQAENCQISSERPDAELFTGSQEGDLFKIRLNGNVSFVLSNQGPDGKTLEGSLTPEQQKVFFERRKEFLTYFVRFLAFPRVIGAATWSSGKIQSLVSCLPKKDPSVANESTIENLIRIELRDQKPLGNTAQLGIQAIARMLQTLDHQIWNDSYVFVNAKSRATSFLFGISGGAALPWAGFFKMYGLQFDFGYDFENKSGYFKRHWVKQNLRSAVLCFESMIAMGLLQQYQLTKDQVSEKSTLVAMPFGFTYRSSENTASFGYLSGLSFGDLLGAGLLLIGQVEAGAAVLTVGKTAGTFSFYSTDMNRTEVATGLWTKLGKKIINWRKSRSCENHLKDDP